MKNYSNSFAEALANASIVVKYETFEESLNRVSQEVGEILMRRYSKGGKQYAKK